MISQEVHLVLNIALKEAVRLRHEFLLTEHLLYSICFNDSALDILQYCDVDTSKIIASLEHYLEKEVKPSLKKDENLQPVSSSTIDRVINRAVSKCIGSERDLCNIGDILVSLMDETECFSVNLLNSYGVDKLKILQSVVRDQDIKDPHNKNISLESKSELKNKDEEFLKQFLVDLNERARQKLIDPLIGRNKEIVDILTILARRKKNNPILVGDPGVGKTAIVEGLALMIEQKKIHPFFKDFCIYSLEVGSLLAGTKFRGDFEERLKRIFTLLQEKKKSIIFIDEIHTIIGTGATGNSQLDISNLLKPLLANASTSCIGATTFQEYRQYFKKDHAFARRFEMIEIKELDRDKALKVLGHLKKSYQNFHNVEYTEDSLSSMVDLSLRYFTEKRLPDSAIDLMDLSAAMLKIEKKKNDTDLSKVNIKDIERLVSKMTNIPVERLGHRQKKILKNLEVEIKKEIFDQDKAVETVVKVIKMSRANLVEQGKPIANLLFTGPTGVGKTELCKVLSRLLNLNLIRLDMSEYMEVHSVSKIIGAPPGYVGYGETSNQITEKIKRYPYSLLLLDEIEKAHRDVLNIFLQVMDYGQLSDSMGTKISFANVLIVMTSNIGAKEMTSGGGIGFLEDDKEVPHRVSDRINQFFLPEFRNRLSATIHFNSLSQGVALQVVQKFLAEFNKLFQSKGVVIHLSDEVVAYFAKKGCSQRMGARPIKRFLDEEIKQVIVDDILFGSLLSGGDVYFSLSDGKIIKSFGTKKKSKKLSVAPEKDKDTKAEDVK